MKDPLYSVFIYTEFVSEGSLKSVLTTVWPRRWDAGLVVFDHQTGRQLDFDWSKKIDEILSEVLPSPTKSGPGRPKLGVVSTEVTLLPRHWEWLNAQPGKASGTLRKLVDEAMAKQNLDPAYRLVVLAKILWSLAGNEPHFEEVSRALYANNRDAAEALIQNWSPDVRAFVRRWT